MSGRFVTLAVIAGLLLSGCGSSGGAAPHTASAAPTDPAPVTSSVVPATSPPAGPPTVPADVPRTGPNLKYRGEKPPVMPAVATQHTRAGAVAFAEFFIRTMDWGYASVSSTYMRHYFTAACKICAGLAEAIDRIVRKHYHVAGNRFEFVGARLVRSGGTNQSEYTIDLPVSVSSGEVVNDDGLFIEGEPSLRLTEHVGVRFASPGWRVVSMGTSR